MSVSFDAAEQQASCKTGDARHATTVDGRVMEYIVYGSKLEDAKVMVQMHGATCSAGLMAEWNHALFVELNLKGIAPSMPNTGYSDVHPKRRIGSFPRDDLAPILVQECVEEFLVDGHSLGTAHALAVAWFFSPDHKEHRCVGMGVNCPYLSTPLCKELGFRCDADDMYMIRNNDPTKWHSAWNFAIADLTFFLPFASPPLKFGASLYPKVDKERPWVFPPIVRDQMRTVARGAKGQGFEMMSYEINSLWGFDARDIKTKNIAIWYAEDDKDCPPEHGRWLAQVFRSKKGVNVSVRDVDIGLGHWSYTPSLGPVYQQEEETIPKTLLSML